MKVNHASEDACPRAIAQLSVTPPLVRAVVALAYVAYFQVVVLGIDEQLGTPRRLLYASPLAGPLFLLGACSCEALACATTPRHPLMQRVHLRGTTPRTHEGIAGLAIGGAARRERHVRYRA